MQVSALAQEVGFGLGAIVLIYFLLDKPWRRDGRPSFDGLFLLAIVLTFWQDPLFSYLKSVLTYNSSLVNLGSWAPYIPGWQSPNGQRIPEPLVWALSAYIIVFCGGSIVINAVMRKAQNRWHLGTARLIAATLAALVIVDLCMESLWIRTGMYSYPGATKGWTLFYATTTSSRSMNCSWPSR
jgi:hypothetical protein